MPNLLVLMSHTVGTDEQTYFCSLTHLEKLYRQQKHVSWFCAEGPDPLRVIAVDDRPEPIVGQHRHIWASRVEVVGFQPTGGCNEDS